MRMCESLEKRVLLTLTTPWNVTSKGTLVVQGTSVDVGADIIHLVAKDGKVAIHWNKLLGFRATRVKRIYVDLGSGDDKVHVDTVPTMPVTILGGNGNDRLSAANGPATLVGGNGHDVLLGSGEVGMDFVGGRGNDRMYGTHAADIFTGGDGFDHAETLFSGLDSANDSLEQQRVLTT
jgi:Ca2+-binding RTX toxin-like protein